MIGEDLEVKGYQSQYPFNYGRYEKYTMENGKIGVKPGMLGTKEMGYSVIWEYDNSDCRFDGVRAYSGTFSFNSFLYPGYIQWTMFVTSNDELIAEIKSEENQKILNVDMVIMNLMPLVLEPGTIKIMINKELIKPYPQVTDIERYWVTNMAIEVYSKKKVDILPLPYENISLYVRK